MDFNFSDTHLAWQARAAALGLTLAVDAPAADVAAAATAADLVSPADLLAAALAVEALAATTSGAAVSFALHLAAHDAAQPAGPVPGETRGVGAVGLSSDDLATEQDGIVNGRATWVGPLTADGFAIVGGRRPVGDATELIACLVALDAPGISVERIPTAALPGVVCGHLAFSDVPCRVLGRPQPVMTRVRVLLAAAGLGMGRRALREALVTAKAHTHRGAGGEQTVQGLLADAATELDAAALLIWKAASADEPSLVDASMAKLAATEATQRAVVRATQVVGADSFRQGHPVEQLAQDVRALELFAGRTEALREAVAEGILPRG